MRRLVYLVIWLSFQAAEAAETSPSQPAEPQSDLDAFMREVLERRVVNWEELRDFVFGEDESWSCTDSI
jgi:hypothetical protein